MLKWLHGMIVCVAVLGASGRAYGLDILFDYQYDLAGNNYFTNNAAARGALEAAAARFETIITDALPAIDVPEPESPNMWTPSFFHPENPILPGGQFNSVALENLAIGADQLRIFVGAGDLSLLGNATQGLGSYGGFNSLSGTQSFVDNILFRGQPEGEFTTWGGAITFNQSTDFSFDHASAPEENKPDFYSVALHELGHVLGLGTSEEWDALWVDASTESDIQVAFNGAATVAEFGGPVPLQFFTQPDGQGGEMLDGTFSGGHWYQDFADYPDLAAWSFEYDSTGVFDVFSPAASMMNPVIFNGDRPSLTILDAAALSDIGWLIPTLPEAPVGEDIDRNRTLDGDDLILLNRAILGLEGDVFDLDGNLHTDALNGVNFDLNGDQNIDALDGAAWLGAFNTFAADFNLDGQVDVADLSTWATGFGSTGALFGQGDADFNGQVDVADLSLWAVNFGNTSVGPISSVNFAVAIPEVSSLWVVMCGAMVVGMRRTPDPGPRTPELKQKQKQRQRQRQKLFNAEGAESAEGRRGRREVEGGSWGGEWEKKNR